MSQETVPHVLIDPNQINFYLHRANRSYLLGKRRRPILRHKGLSAPHVILLALMILVFAIVVRAQFEAAEYDYLELKNHGVVARGEVTARRIETNPKVKRYLIDYQFAVDGLIYCAEQGVSHDHYEKLSDGQPIDILYSPANPDFSRLAGTNSDPGLVTAIPMALGALALLLTGYAIYRYWRDVHDHKQGITLLGQVTAIRLSTGWINYDRHDNTIDFVFCPQGQPQKMTERAKFWGYLAPANAPHKGDTIAVFYVDESHWWIL